MDPERAAILSRFEYRSPTVRQGVALAEVHDLIVAVAEFVVDALPNSRDRALALTSLEDTRMKINKAVVFSDLG